MRQQWRTQFFSPKPRTLGTNLVSRFQPSRTFTASVASPNSPSSYAAIIGSGPAGFYAARKLQSLLPNGRIDLYEQLPAPFGLVRYGVAPDHPEVKNCQDTFNEVAESPNFNFIGNVDVGHQLPIKYLRPHYDALLFAYGASKDRELGIPGEKVGSEPQMHVYSARAFVGWYNGLPEYRHLNPDLEAGEDAVIIGQGNVALDVARTLLADVDRLRGTDMTDYALATLAKSKIRNVRIVGRRGPVQGAFTIKEVRELLQLPDVSFRPIPDHLFPADLKALPRPQRRILELLKKGSSSPATSPKSWSLDFLLSPQALHFSPTEADTLSQISFTPTVLSDPNDPTSPLLPPSSPTPTPTTIPCTTLFRSIGYKSHPLPDFHTAIPFNKHHGTFPHDGSGRIVSMGTPIPGLYCAGWVKRGPTGVIASTMTDAFITAEAIAADIHSSNDIPNSQNSDSSSAKNPSPPRTGWKGVLKDAQRDGIQLRPVSWGDWLRIDAVERQRGRMAGVVGKGGAGGGDGDGVGAGGWEKPREKIADVREMLRVLDE